MLSYRDAVEIISRLGEIHAANRGVEVVPTVAAGGRQLAEAVVAHDCNPRFDNSAMDGYAVVAAETAPASSSRPVMLQIRGVVKAGDAQVSLIHAPGECLEIMTGAVIPDPFDAVVRVEDALRTDGVEPRATLVHPAKRGDNIRRKGEDIRVGQHLMDRGAVVGPQHILALSMLGHSEVKVFARPRVAILSTGNEIRQSSCEDLGDQEVRNCTAPFLCELLQMYGAEPTFYGIVPDDSTALRHAFESVLEHEPDIVLSTGGVSAGKFDLVKDVLHELGFSEQFHKVAVRPGKPLLCGELLGGRSIFFGLPGNPLSVVTATRFFVKPFIAAFTRRGADQESTARLEGTFTKPDGLTCFLRARLEGERLHILDGQGSAAVASLLECNGWVVTSADSRGYANGDEITWCSLW